jgi:hypothetical protein
VISSRAKTEKHITDSRREIASSVERSELSHRPLTFHEYISNFNPESRVFKMAVPFDTLENGKLQMSRKNAGLTEGYEIYSDRF